MHTPVTVCLILFPTIYFQMERLTVEWPITLKFSSWFHSKPHQFILDCSKVSNNPLAQSKCKLLSKVTGKKNQFANLSKTAFSFLYSQETPAEDTKL